MEEKINTERWKNNHQRASKTRLKNVLNLVTRIFQKEEEKMDLL